MANHLHSLDLHEAASSVDDQSINDQTTNEQTSTVQLTNDHSTNDKSNSGQFINEQLTNDKLTNDQLNTDQLTNDHSNNDQSSNDQFRNDPSSIDMSISLGSSCDESSSHQSEVDQNMDVDLLSSELLQAACSGNVEEVTDVLDKFSVDQSESKYSRAALVNVKNKGGDTALFLALSQRKENVMAVRTLVSAGADINTFNKLGQTPLVHALNYCSLGFIRELIQLGADVNQHATYGYSPLMIGIEREDCLPLLIELIEAGADLNAQFYDTINGFRNFFSGHTALMQAVCSLTDLNLNCVKLLLQAGANVNVKNHDGEAALCIVVWQMIHTDNYSASDGIECLRLLINYGADVNSRYAWGDTALMHLARSVFSCRNNQIYTEVLSILIDAEANLNMKSSDGETALMLAIKAGTTKNQYHDPLFIYPAITRFVELFIKAKADVMSTNTAGQTALMYAVKDDNLVSLLSMMVNTGADIDQQDSSGMTTLAHAVSNGSLDCVRWLVDHGASVNICDFSGRTHLAHAVSNGRHGCVRWLIDFGVSVNIRDNSGKTLLHYLMFANNSDRDAKQCLEVLLSKLPDVNVRDNDGMTPLMYVAQKYQGGPCTWNTNITMKKLLQHWAELNLVDNKGQTALIHSLRLIPHPDDVLEENDKICGYLYNINVEFLLDKGADFSVGHLAEGQLARLRRIRGDRGLIKLRVGNDVDLEAPWDNFHHVVARESRDLLQFLILKGVMPLPSLCYAIGSSPLELEMPVVHSMSNVATAKYLIATCYLRSVDLTCSIDTSLTDFQCQRQAFTMIENLRSQPWPLVKLCFVAVSTSFGASPGRQERVKNSQLPPKLQRMFLFQEPSSRLCVHQWDKIPLTFSPEDYENLPQPRPLLYNWPVGRALLPCDCEKCDGTMYKYDQEEEDTENGGE